MNPAKIRKADEQDAKKGRGAARYWQRRTKRFLRGAGRGTFEWIELDHTQCRPNVGNMHNVYVSQSDGDNTNDGLNVGYPFE